MNRYAPPLTADDQTNVVVRHGTQCADGTTFSTKPREVVEVAQPFLPEASSDLDDLHVTAKVNRITVVTADSYPTPGDQYCNFEILNEIGSGAAGRVYLAKQPSMGSRLVVLKVGEHLTNECEKLSVLQHPNIVPVHSLHRHNSLQIVCMPYRGAVTLAHVVSRLKDQNFETMSGESITTIITDCRKTREKPLEVALGSQSYTSEVVSTKTTKKSVATINGMPFVDAVLSLIRGIVRGIQFAHSERIVHSDLKPANILIPDDGILQIIDFGVACDLSIPAANQMVLGGTRPYASPEQLETLIHSSVRHDERSDLYSIGVILYEMLTGLHPYPYGLDSQNLSLSADRERRFQLPPSPRNWNRQIPLAVESIIQRCLAATPSERYQSAQELLIDIECQMARRPLKYAPNTSRRELFEKWTTRNRWFIAAGMALVIGGTTTSLLHAQSLRQREQLAVHDAFSLADQFDRDARKIQTALSVSTNDVRETAAVVASGEELLKSQSVMEATRWWEVGANAKLSLAKQVQIRERAALLLLDLSRSVGHRGLNSKETDRGGLSQALEWNWKAIESYPAVEPPRGAWTQRAWLARLAGMVQVADYALRRASETDLKTSIDYRIEGRELMDQGKWRESKSLLTKAVELDPSDFSSSFAQGLIHYRIGDDRAAVASFNVCVSLDPTVPGVYFNRGLCHLRLREFSEAEEDFSRVIEGKSDWSDPYLNRASAREGTKNYKGAVEDLTRALELGHPPTALLFSRSRVYSRLGLHDLAKQDFELGMRNPPTDDRGWIARGLAKMPKDPTAEAKAYEPCLNDFAQALSLNPRSVTALQYQARAYSKSQQNELAIATLSELLKHNPETLDALSGRAMLYSRLGKRQEAHADAEEALKLCEENPRTIYQLAGVYAMTSKTHSEDKREAFRLLASALRKGFGFELLDKDRELDPLRSDPEFYRVIDAAKRVARQRPKL
jgi:eukaryotic-like serine/threonine-protein kinase